ncbi:MAG: hypothetical protein ABI947_01300 [Chloroflexota bacterium]
MMYEPEEPVTPQSEFSEFEDVPESEATAESSKSPLHTFASHQRKAAKEACQAIDALIPPDFRTHGRAAREEFLLSFKVLIDGASAAVENELKKAQANRAASDSNSGPSTTGKTKVKVEVS